MNELEKPMLLNAEGIDYLRKARKWALVMGISGLLILAGLLAGYLLMLLTPILPGGQMSYIIFPAMLFLAVWFFPVWYLFRFTRYARQAIALRSPEALSLAMRCLWQHYRCMGILMVLAALLYIVPFASGILFSPAQS